MKKNINAGDLKERIQVMKLEYDEDKNEWTWNLSHKSRCKADLGERKNLFSEVGIGARDVTFTVRHRADLTLMNAISWFNHGTWEHCFISSIIPLNGLYDQVHCARVETVRCLAEANHDPTGSYFPGVLTEKYIRYEDFDPYSGNLTVHVLVTPKNITLKRGSLVDVAGTPYKVLLGHTLDVWKNEYEIALNEDL